MPPDTRSADTSTPQRGALAWLLPLVLLLALGTLRGGATSLAKYVSMAGVPPLGYALWQCATASLILLVIARLRRAPIPLDRRHLRYYAICGVVGTAAPNSLYFLVLRHVPAGSMAVLLTTIPLVTFAIVLGARLERADARRALGIAIGLAGAALVVLPGGAAPDATVAGWLLLGCLCPLLYATNSVIASRQPIGGADPTVLAGGTLAAGALFVAPLVVATDSFHPLWRDASLADALVLGHGVIAAAAYSLFFTLVRVAGPVFYSQTAYVIALTGIGWGMLVFDERHPASFWLAVVLVFAGVLLVNSRQRAVRATRRDPPSGRSA